MAILVFNCQKVSFRNTLGIPHFVISMAKALSTDHEIVIAIPNDVEFLAAPENEHVIDLFDRVMSIADAKVHFEGNPEAIEILPHHFQATMVCDKSMMVCHDMHIYDVPWKYNNVKQVQERFARDLSNATAVLAHFPRTYYGVEHFAKISIPNLFFTPSPLTLDPTMAGWGFEEVENDIPFFLYPAQLQKHKNHKSLILAARLLKDRGVSVKIKCSGSDFNVDFTAELKEMIVQNDVADVIELLGHISTERLVDLYKNCDGLIIPSAAEGGGHVAMEGLSAGKPVAINSIESARMHLQQIDAHVSWFDAGEPETIVAAIESVLSMNARDVFDKNMQARERIAQMTPENVAVYWNKIIDYLIGKTPKPILQVNNDYWDIEYV